MHIRPAVLIDAEAISELQLESAKEFVVPEFTETAAKQFLATIRPQSVLENMKAGFRYYVAEKEQDIMGFIALRQRSHLFNLFVRKTYHRQGVARALWQFARDEVLEEGGVAEFTVNASTYSIFVYRRFGFEVVGEKQRRNGVVSTPMRLIV